MKLFEKTGFYRCQRANTRTVWSKWAFGHPPSGPFFILLIFLLLLFLLLLTHHASTTLAFLLLKHTILSHWKASAYFVLSAWDTHVPTSQHQLVLQVTALNPQNKLPWPPSLTQVPLLEGVSPELSPLFFLHISFTISNFVFIFVVICLMSTFLFRLCVPKGTYCNSVFKLLAVCKLPSKHWRTDDIRNIC